MDDIIEVLQSHEVSFILFGLQKMYFKNFFQFLAQTH